MSWILLLVPALQAGADDAYIHGYATAILEREFSLSGVQVRVADGVIALPGDALRDADKEKVVAALSRIRGVKQVAFQDAPPAAPSPPASSAAWELFPDWRLFAPLLADPRWPHFSAAYKYHSGEDEIVRQAASVSFGEFFSLAGYDTGSAGRFELGVQAGVFATFDLASDSFDLINADYRIGLPLAYRTGPLSAQAQVYHQSSHLGDEFLLRAAVDRINVSYESADLKLSYALDQFRLYAGVGYMVHTDPKDLKPWSAQAGVEFDSRTGWFGGFLSPVAAVDLQRHQETGSGFDVSARLGIELEKPDSSKRRILLLFEYYHGRNPDGQFFDRKIQTFGLGLHLHF